MTTEKPLCLNTSCTFSTIKPPSKLTLPGSCLCSWLCCFDWDPDQRERADGWNQPMLPNSSITESQTCLSESKVNTMTATIVSDYWVLNLSPLWALVLFVLWSISQNSADWRLYRPQHWFCLTWRQRRNRPQRLSLGSWSWFLCSLAIRDLRVRIRASNVATNPFTTLLVVHSSSYRLHS